MGVLREFEHTTSPISGWAGDPKTIQYSMDGIKSALQDLSQSLFIVKEQEKLGIAPTGNLAPLDDDSDSIKLICALPSFPIDRLGDPSFKTFYGTKYAYYAGSMAHAISSEELVISMGKAGFLAAFGAGGVHPNRVESAIHQIQSALPDGPYAFNLIFNPNEPALERKAVELYLKHGVTTIEASAFLDITAPLVYYRVAGLSLNQDGTIHRKNRVIAKLSRKEVARRFMQPAPRDILNDLRNRDLITEAQYNLAGEVSLADDITVEADSGGHTDNRPLVCLMPAMIALRDEIQKDYCYLHAIRIGAAGGISTPESALAAFMMGAAYIATGSINQGCLEAGASEHTRKLLSQADMAEVIMAPAADMFEMGVKVQVLKRGTMFAMRAQKLYELYKNYASINEIPPAERSRIEKQIFRKDLDQIWEDTVSFFNERDPKQVQRAESDSKYKMALIFRWYLGLSSHWSNHGEKGREMDYQIWCGPAMGAFNDWARGTYLEEPQNRRVVDLGKQILTGAAYLYRLQVLKSFGITIPPELCVFKPGDTQKF